MGLRGPGSTARKRAAEKVKERKHKRRLPWKNKGLSRSERVRRFVQWLPVTKGMKAGKRIRLLPHQLDFIRNVYRPDNEVQVSIAILSEPKGNGKTGLIAAIMLCHLLGPEAEPRGEVYSASVDRELAGILYNEMVAIIEEVPEFAERCNIIRHTKTIEVLSGDGKGSKFEALSSDARKAHGRSPTCWGFDELAQVPTRTLLENLIESAGKRERCLGFILSTQAEDDAHVLSQMIDDGLDVVDGEIYVQLMTADIDLSDEHDAEVRAFDMETIRQCNPALGKFLNPKQIAVNADRARKLPAFRNSFYNLRLNLRVSQAEESRLFPRTLWKSGNMSIDPESLRGRRCYGGLDLSAKHDLTSLVLAFPDDQTDTCYDVLAYFWTPLGQMSSRSEKEREQFNDWIRDGWMEGIPGKVIRESVLAERLGEFKEMFDIAAIGFDRWGIERLKLELEAAGLELPLVPFGQGFKDISPAIDYLAELVLDARLTHGGNPVLTACVANAIVIGDDADNRKFAKGRSNRKSIVRIDGAVALTMAVGTAKRAIDAEPETGSYLDSGEHELALV